MSLFARDLQIRGATDRQTTRLACEYDKCGRIDLDHSPEADQDADGGDDAGLVSNRDETLVKRLRRQLDAPKFDKHTEFAI